MANGRPRSSGIFTGVVLITFGALLLLRNYRGFEFHDVLIRWWPLVLIFWGLIKLYERTTSRNIEPGTSRITASEIFLVLGLLLLVGVVIAVDTIKGKFPNANIEFGDFGRNSYNYDLEVPPKKVPPNSRITIRATRGDITVRPADNSEIRVTGKKNVRAWNEDDAVKFSSNAAVEILQNGDGYEIRPSGSNTGDSRLGFDMEVLIPQKSPLTIRNDKGDVVVSDLLAPVTVNNLNGDVEVRNVAGDVNVDMRHGDVKVSDISGDIKLSGKGGQVDVASVAGGLTLDGDFYGPIRADKIAKGVRYISQRTDLTLTQLGGHLELESGSLQIADAPGSLQLRTNRYNLEIENVGGKVKIDNRDGSIDVRYSFPPKDDIEIVNANASIALSLPGNSSFTINADCHSCEIDSDFSAPSLVKSSGNNGDTHLQGTYGSGRPAKINLKTTYDSIAIRRTTADSMSIPKPPRVPAVSHIPEIPKPEEN